MKLRRLKLENFRQYRQAEVLFKDGMTAIVGANGSGKTTLLEAITYALYGAQRQDKGTLYCLWASPEEKIRCVAELEFEFDGRIFKVERKLSGKNYTANAALDERVGSSWENRASGADAVRESVQKLLGLTFDQFVNSFCAEQKQLAFLNFRSKADRQQEVARMLGFDRLRLASQRASERAKEAKAKRAAIAQNLGNPEEFRRLLAEAEQVLIERRREEAELRRELEKAEGLLLSAQDGLARAKDWDRLTNLLNELRAKAEGLKAGVKAAEDTVADAKRRTIRRAELEPVGAQMAQLQQEQKTHEAQQLAAGELQQWLGTKKGAEEDLVALQNELASLASPNLEELEEVAKAARLSHDLAKTSENEALQTWNLTKTQAAQLAATTREAARAAQANLDKGEKSARLGICPECGQPTAGGQFDTILEARRKSKEEADLAAHEAHQQEELAKAEPAALIAAREAVCQAVEAFTEAQTKFEAGRSAQEKRRAHEAQLAQKKATIDRLAKQIAESSVQYDPEAHNRVRQAIGQMKPAYEEYLSLRDAADQLVQAESRLAQATGAWEQAKASNQELKEERTKLGIENEEEKQRLVQEANDLATRRATLAEKIKGIATQCGLLETQVKTANERLAEHAKAAADLQTYEAEELLNRTIAEEMKALRDQLNQQIRPDLEERASSNLNLLTNGRYTHVRLDEDFMPKVEDDGTPKSVISGGEEDVLALALRLSLAELIQERNGRPMALLMLDEVFGSLDGDRRQAVLDRLGTIKNKFAQILLISHIEEINQVADQCLYVSLDGKARCSVVSDVQDRAGFEAGLDEGF